MLSWYSYSLIPLPDKDSLSERDNSAQKTKLEGETPLSLPSPHRIGIGWGGGVLLWGDVTQGGTRSEPDGPASFCPGLV